MAQVALSRVGFLLWDSSTRAGKLTNATLYVLNIAFVMAYIVSTYSLPAPYGLAIHGVELGLGVVFLGEYVVRVRSADSPRAEMTSPYTVVDLAAVLVGFVLVPWQVSRLRDIPDVRDTTCPRCGEAVNERDRYCRRCGTEFDGDVLAADESTQ